MGGVVGPDGAVNAVAVGALPAGTPLAHPLDLSDPVRGVALYGNIIVTAAGRDIALHRPAAP